VAHPKDGTQKIYSYPEETMERATNMQDTNTANHEWPVQSPEVEALVRDIIGKIADRWTLLVLDLMEDKGALVKSFAVLKV
jgi:hypothetical protein